MGLMIKKDSIRQQFEDWYHDDNRCILYLYGDKQNIHLNKDDTPTGKVEMIFTNEKDALNRIYNKNTDYNGYARIVYKDNSCKDFHKL